MFDGHPFGVAIDTFEDGNNVLSMKVSLCRRTMCFAGQQRTAICRSRALYRKYGAGWCWTGCRFHAVA
jgi:hypothetical protein